MKKISDFRNEKELCDYLTSQYNKFYLDYLNERKEISLKDFEMYVNEKMGQFWKVR